ncbi:hypothetical protein GMMP1_540047 [Candidatus Magnetomoraceae bacterium gMMP-1]
MLNIIRLYYMVSILVLIILSSPAFECKLFAFPSRDARPCVSAESPSSKDLKRFKTIIVAGGGQHSDNNLWRATKKCTDFAFQTIRYQGMSRENISYLSSETDGLKDKLKNKFTRWAGDAETLIVYLTGHGGDGVLRINQKDVLKASELDQWLDNLSCRVILIIDVCKSGSFLSALTPSKDQERIIIASAGPDEKAYFIEQGAVSFSNYFWKNIAKGASLFHAFNLAKNAMQAYQNPILDDNGNGLGNEAQDGILSDSIFIGKAGNNLVPQAKNPPWPPFRKGEKLNLVPQLGNAQDLYENDNEFTKANIIVMDSPAPQYHNFHSPDDQDWLMFYGVKGEHYEIALTDLGCNTAIELYDSDGTTILKNSLSKSSEDKFMSWTCTREGRYYIKIKKINLNNYTLNTEYNIKIYRPIAIFPGFISGTITDVLGKPINGVNIKTNGGASTISSDNGTYVIVDDEGRYTLTANADGYQAYTTQVTILPLDEIVLNFLLHSDICGDVNENQRLDIGDAMFIAQYLVNTREFSNESVSVNLGDVNCNGELDIGDAMFIAKYLVETRDCVCDTSHRKICH